MSYNKLFEDYYVVATSNGEQKFPKTYLGFTKMVNLLTIEDKEFGDITNAVYMLVKSLGCDATKIEVQNYLFYRSFDELFTKFSWFVNRRFSRGFVYMDSVYDSMLYNNFERYLPNKFKTIIKNFVMLHNGQVVEINNSIMVNYNRYRKEKSLVKSIKMCEDCGKRFVDMEIYNGNQHIDTDDQGHCDMCNRCLIDSGDYVECEDCGKIVPIDEATYLDRYDKYVCNDCLDSNYFECEDCGELTHCDDDISDDNIHICRDCYNDHYTRCDYCGNLIDTNGDYEYCEENSNYYCDSGCAENDGLHWSYNHDCWTMNDETIEHGYHDYDYSPLGKSSSKNHFLGSGSEIEVCGSSVSQDYEFWVGVYEVLGEEKYGIISHDGSVDEEIVMQPMTEKYFNQFDWEGLFKKLVSGGCTSHDNEQCGCHTHYSAYYLGRNFKEISRNAKKVVAFFEKNWDELVKFCRRKDSQLHWCEKYGFEITNKTNLNDLTKTRYRAVNLQNIDEYSLYSSTIEIRLPRGTLNAKTFRATVDFFRHIVRNAKRISWKNIDNLKLWFKGIKDKNTIEYIKSRNCFEGQF